jgi:hypothetical protein
MKPASLWRWFRDKKSQVEKDTEPKSSPTWRSSYLKVHLPQDFQIFLWTVTLNCCSLPTVNCSLTWCGKTVTPAPLTVAEFQPITNDQIFNPCSNKTDTAVTKWLSPHLWLLYVTSFSLAINITCWCGGRELLACLLCSPGWLGTLDPPTSVSGVLGLYPSTITPSHRWEFSEPFLIQTATWFNSK